MGGAYFGGDDGWCDGDDCDESVVGDQDAIHGEFLVVRCCGSVADLVKGTIYNGAERKTVQAYP
jgi:hypothetical protein